MDDGLLILYFCIVPLLLLDQNVKFHHVVVAFHDVRVSPSDRISLTVCSARLQCLFVVLSSVPPSPNSHTTTRWVDNTKEKILLPVLPAVEWVWIFRISVGCSWCMGHSDIQNYRLYMPKEWRLCVVGMDPIIFRFRTT